MRFTHYGPQDMMTNGRTMISLRRILCAMPIWTAVALCPVMAGSAEIIVFAAASLKPALDPIAADWASATGNVVTISFGGSPALAKQIQSGAPADLFISASSEWMDLLAAEDLITPGSRVDLVSNRLVLVAHGDSVGPVDLSGSPDLHGLLQGGKLSMAMVDSVPAGQYGKEALETLGLWANVADDIVESDNVRAALRLVELGEATMGVVYASDLIDSHGVTRVATFPASSHRPILYPAALTRIAPLPVAQDFLNELSSDASKAVFAQKGFVLLDAVAP
jgi:molybdate transport system substrate-binding protein